MRPQRIVLRSGMRLFHFSEEPGIAEFVPRPVKVPTDRPPGREWLNADLVWAIEDTRQALYLFPRDCPRIILWARAQTTEADVTRWLEGRRENMLTCIERAWLGRLNSTTLYRYEFGAHSFTDLEDAGMWVSRETVRPIACEKLTDLPSRLRESGAQLRVVDSLLPWKNVWASSLHASGIRLRHATNWNTP